MLLLYFTPQWLLEIKTCKLISDWTSACIVMPYWIDAVLFLTARSVRQFVLLGGLKQETPQFKMYVGNGEEYCSDWVWEKFIFMIRLHSLKLSTYKDEGFLPAWRNMHCIIVIPESFGALMHGHNSALHLIHICVSLGTPRTGEL